MSKTECRDSVAHGTPATLVCAQPVSCLFYFVLFWFFFSLILFLVFLPCPPSQYWPFLLPTKRGFNIFDHLTGISLRLVVAAGEKGEVCWLLCFEIRLLTNSSLQQALIQLLGDERLLRRSPSLPSGGVRPDAFPSTSP